MNSASPRPNFFIAGSPKSGTTSLWEYVNQHPEIFMSNPIKEPMYFVWGEEDNEFDFADWKYTPLACHKDFNAYLSLFRGASKAKVVGEATPFYLAHPMAAEKIQRKFPKAKIVIVLRNPVDRAYSHFTYNKMRYLENSVSFRQALEVEQSLANPYYSIAYESTGRYFEQVKRFIDLFDRENVLVFTFEDLIDRPQEVCSTIFAFLEVDPSFQINALERENVTLERGNSTALLYRLKGSNSTLGKAAQFLHRVFANSKIYLRFKKLIYVNLRRTTEKSGAKRPDKISAQERRYLGLRLQGDIEQLEKLIGRDLSAWKIEN